MTGGNSPWWRVSRPIGNGSKRVNFTGSPNSTVQPWHSYTLDPDRLWPRMMYCVARQMGQRKVSIAAG